MTRDSWFKPRYNLCPTRKLSSIYLYVFDHGGITEKINFGSWLTRQEHSLVWSLGKQVTNLLSTHQAQEQIPYKTLTGYLRTEDNYFLEIHNTILHHIIYNQCLLE
jgi:hypothetical protein